MTSKTNQDVTKPMRRFPLWLRWVLGGPVALIIAIAIMACLARIMPNGTPDFNFIVFSLLAFPAIWAGVVIYIILEEGPIRATLVCTGVIAFCSYVLYSAFTQTVA